MFELLLEPNDNPAAKHSQEAIFKQGIAATAFNVEDIQKEYKRLEKLGCIYHETNKDGTSDCGSI